MAVVQSALKKLHVDVLLTAEDSVQATDAVASDQEVQSIAQRFQSAGVNVVVGVGGSGSTTWPRARSDNQSTYNPTYIATSESSLISYVESTKGANTYLDNVIAATSAPTSVPELEGSGDPEVRRQRPQGLPVGHHHTAGQPDQSPGGSQQHRHDVCLARRGLSVHGAVRRDRRRGRQEPDRGELHQSGLRA